MNLAVNLKAKIESSSLWKDRSKRIFILAFILSILFHAVLFLFLNLNSLLNPKIVTPEKDKPEELVITFPENKPKPRPKEWKIVQNINENEQIPDKTDLLSDKNSRASNPEMTTQKGALPKSTGNAALPDFSPAPSFKSFQKFQNKTFTKSALGEETSMALNDSRAQQTQKFQPQSQARQGANQIMNQKDFSVEDLGAISLSTYKWEWAPYVNALKNKLYQVWFAPPAYYQLGLIHGYTIVRFTIDKQGQMTDIQVLKHVGHKSLQLSSTEAIKALFPFLPLPKDFPDKTLTITAKLIYPDLRQGR